MKILIVDDQAAVRGVIKMLVSDVVEDMSLSLDLHEAKNCEEALNITRDMDTKPDLILTDIHMPGMSLNDYLKEMSSDENFKNIPIIVVSGAADDYIVKSIRLGVRGYLKKPMSMDGLTKVIEKFKPA
jgi:YesN/AraC family two-component response regulator